MISWQVLFQFLLDFNFTKGTSMPNLGVPYLRPFFKPIYPLAVTIVFYSVLFVLGVAGKNNMLS